MTIKNSFSPDFQSPASCPEFPLNVLFRFAEPLLNPSEDGRGYGIDVQGDTIVVTTYAYGNNGQMQWYLSSGKITGNGTLFTGKLLKVNSGQCLSCVWTNPPTFIGDDGTISIFFTSRTTGTLTLPNGRQSAIQRQNFGVGGPPDSLLGEWLYAYTIISTFAERFRYTTKGSAGTFGNGLVIDPIAPGGAEFQTSGAYAGRVLAIRTNSTITQTLDVYVYNLYLEEGRGSWVSQLTGTTYGLNAYKTATLGGLSKSLAAPAGGESSLAAPIDGETLQLDSSKKGKNKEDLARKSVRLNVETMSEAESAVVEGLRQRLAMEIQSLNLTDKEQK